MTDTCQLCGKHITEHGSGEGFPCPEGAKFSESRYFRHLESKIATIDKVAEWMKYIYKASAMVLAIIGGALLTDNYIVAQVIGAVFLFVGVAFYQLLSWCFKEAPRG